MFNFCKALLALASVCAFSAPAFAYSSFGSLQINKLIVMPSHEGHADWIQAIEGARQSIHLEIYHLTDKAVIEALAKKAKSSGIDIKVIVDGASFKGGYQKAVASLVAAGGDVRPSSKAFSLTHSKGMVVDQSTAFITAINLTNTTENTRDFGIITPDPGVIVEMESVFQTDWQNSQSGGMDTPSLSQPNLIWSPTDSRQKLVELIDSATSTLVMQVESLSDSTMVDAFSRAAKRGVNVEVMTPECVMGNGLFNFPALAKLIEAGAHAHVMAGPSSFDQPYIHSKMIVVDSNTIYIGSVNFTYNSLDKDREMGVIFSDPSTAYQMIEVFNTDWSRSVEPEQNPSTALCHAS